MTGDILVVVEHRNGEIRDITWEMLGKARELTESQGGSVTALLLGADVGGMAQAVAERVPAVDVFDDAKLANFNSDPYQEVLAGVIKERKPVLTLLGQTAYGLELGPSLAADLGLPLVTDINGIDLSAGTIAATRSWYGAQTCARVVAKASQAILMVQSGAFPQASPLECPGTIARRQTVIAQDLTRKEFIAFIEAMLGDVDITQSDIVVSVGRGIGDPSDLPLVEELATALGGVLACSRPVVDKKWLPKSRQVGISGKTVQPKLYLAIGISGSFQHLSGIKGAGMLVAVNKDPKAPIFRVADYGIVGDLFNVVPALTERVRNARAK
jgi:electron transfer flavoprotein alpha subunit